MNDNIIDFLDLSDNDSEITDVSVDGSTKHITIEKKLTPRYCPVCSTRLHSKGKFIRHPNHQILQDGYTLQITAVGRRWFCPNPLCSHTETDQFSFIRKRKKNTSIIDFMILQSMKDLSLSCVQIARMYGVSDSYVHQLFLRYIDLPRKPLSTYISIDEVYINLSPKCKYAIVIMDFVTGDILDILQSRRKEYTESYFLSIPKQERDGVKYLISDMYNPYINYTSSYFVHAQPIVDSFHVLQWLNNLINRYINNVKRRYQERDRKILEKRNYSHNTDFQSHKESKEVYILNHARWVMLLNQKHWYYRERRLNRRLNMYMDTLLWEQAFLSLDDHFAEIRTLKDLYDSFNESYVNDLENAGRRLDELIELYKESHLDIFRQFSHLLKTYHDPIIASFTYLTEETQEEHLAVFRRLSNGPMESFNNKPSSLRSQSHGISNFDFFRNRILWAERKDAPLLAVPKSKEAVHTYTNKKRGHYKSGH